MNSGSEPNNSRYSSRRQSSRYTALPDDQRWQLTLKKEQKSASDGLQRDVIRERLANVNAATLFSKNKIRLAMQDIYRSQRDVRKRVESEFEISLAEIGMYREKNRRVVMVLSGMRDEERKARQEIESHELFFREWRIDQRVKLFQNEFTHRSSIERGFFSGMWELNTADVTYRHALCISEGESRDRSTISCLRDSQITEIYERFHYVFEQSRYFTAAIASFFDEVTFKSSETMAEEHEEWNILRNSWREAHELLRSFVQSKDQVCRQESTARKEVRQESEARYSEILREFRQRKQHILDEKKRAYEKQSGLIIREKIDRKNVSGDEAHAWSLLAKACRSSENSVRTFLRNAASLMAQKYQHVVQEKEHILHASRNELELSVNELWESYRMHQEILAEKRVLLEKHLQKKEEFATAEEIVRHQLMSTESDNYMEILNIYQTERAALVNILESFHQARLALFNEWQVLAWQSLEAHQRDIYTLAQNYRELTSCEIQNFAERVELERNEETSWNALMLMATNSKASLFVSSAVAELESFEAYERNARTIAHWMSFSEMHVNFISSVYKIMLVELEAVETEHRGRIEEDFSMACDELNASMPQPISEPAVNPADMIIDNMEYQNAIHLLRSEADFLDAEMNALAVRQISGIARVIEKLRETEFAAFQKCEHLEEAERAIDIKIKAKRQVIKCLTEDVDDAKRAILKHAAAQKARQVSVKNMKHQRMARNTMTKKKLQEVEKQVRSAAEERERTRDSVRDSLRSSPLAKRGKPS